MKRMIIGIALIAAALGLAAPAQAAPFVVPPGLGCDTVGHPVLLSWIEKRTVCDGPKRPDGSWTRARFIWIPAHTTPGYCDDYSCTMSQSYGDNVVEQTTYPVSDAPGAPNPPLPDEPDWLPPGTNNYA